MKKVLTGNHAVSYGVMVSRVQVIAAYPITPQTQVVERLAKLCASGQLSARFIEVESEHSAMASCIGASVTGARAFTATSSQGLALMHEMLHWAAGGRLPIVMANINRALAPPWNIWTDQNDSLSQRDTGWLQFYCEDNQEVLDTVIQAFKVSEQIMLPSMLVLDGFFLSHTTEPVDIPAIEVVDSYLPRYEPERKLDVAQPYAFEALTKPDVYAELRWGMQMAMEEAKEVAARADEEFGKALGRSYGLVEEYRVGDAEIVLVASGTVASTCREVIDDLRGGGKKVGMLKVRMFRPFPAEEVRRGLKSAQKVAVIDRNISFGHGGIFCQEVKSALYNRKATPPVFGFIAGIGGKDVTPELIEEVVDYTSVHDQPEKDTIWMGMSK